jgi:hypothetical protein
LDHHPCFQVNFQPHHAAVGHALGRVCRSDQIAKDASLLFLLDQGFNQAATVRRGAAILVNPASFLSGCPGRFTKAGP